MNIIFISLDTLRADHLGCYGYFRDTSPNLDQLAREGVRFENYISEAAHTVPAYTSMFTGLTPVTHGVMGTIWCLENENVDLLDDTTPMLAECLQAEGYVTCAVDNLHGMAFHPKWFPRGFEYYINYSRHPRKGKPKADAVNARALPWIEQHADDEFFLFVHYWDPHAGYGPPEPFDAVFPATADGAPSYTLSDGAEFVSRWGRRDRLTENALRRIALYDCEIRYVDDHVGQLLALLRRLGLYDETLILVNADHGDDMTEHTANFEHRECYDTTIRTPLIVKAPKSVQEPNTAGPVVEDLAGHVDITPTVLDFVGASDVPPMDGRSLKPFLIGEEGETRKATRSTGYWIWDAGHWKSAEMAARTKQWKYIERADVADIVSGPKPTIGFYHSNPGTFMALPQRELYDVASDHDEQVNLIDAKPDMAADMQKKLEPWLTSGMMAGR